MRWVVTKPAGASVLVLAIGMLAQCREDSGEAADPSQQDAMTDAPADAPPGEQPPDGPDPLAGCKTLAEEWAAFVATHRSCGSVADCTVVGGAGGAVWCVNCSPSIGDGSGDPIANSALPEAEPYLAKFHACVVADLWDGCTWDAAPAKNLRCEDGVCKADPGSCHVLDAPVGEPDAELDASTADASG